jgi:hypothetical protein
MRITRRQAAALHEQVRRRYVYFRRVRERLEQIGYLTSDELYQAALMAEHGAHSLMILSFYDSLESGVGHPARQPGAAEIAKSNPQ